MTTTAVPDPAATPYESADSWPVRIVQSVVLCIADDPLARWQWAAVGIYVAGLFSLAGAAYTPFQGIGVNASTCAPDSMHASVQAWLHPEKYLRRAIAAIPAEGGDSPYARCRLELEKRLAVYARMHAGGHGAEHGQGHGEKSAHPAPDDCAPRKHD